MINYQNKVVWITGASSGIGEALAYQFAKAGSRLVLSARREAELLRVKKQCGLADEQILVLPLDVMAFDQMPDQVALVVQHFGRIDLLVNNAGISQRSMVIDTDMSVYKRLMDVNYLGTVAITKEVLKVFLKQGGGQFAVISSLMGKFASPLRSGYCGAKHALHGFFDALRLEYEDQQVQVSIFCPGYIKTNISMNALTADGKAQNKMDQATGNGLSAEACAQQIFQGLRKGKKEVLIGGKETLAVYIKRLFPGLLHKIVKRANVT